MVSDGVQEEYIEKSIQEKQIELENIKLINMQLFTLSNSTMVIKCCSWSIIPEKLALIVQIDIFHQLMARSLQIVLD